MAKSSISVSIKNDHTKEAFALIGDRLDKALELCGQQAERNAKINLETDPRRVDTGLLRNSITHAMGGEAPAISSYHSNGTHGHTDSTERRGIAGLPVSNATSGTYSGTAPNNPHTMYIGTNVEYAPYVHEGTQRMRANRFLRDAIAGHENEYKAIIDKAMKSGTA